jgi:hypothetical protein
MGTFSLLEVWKMKCKCLWALGVFALSVAVYAGPRPAGDATPQSVEKVKYVGYSRFTELPPLPPNAKLNVEPQPLYVPVPIFEVLSDEEMARGGTANTGAGTAMVYSAPFDSGYGNFNKSEPGNFVGNLLHLGNGFPLTGGEIKGYDTLVYHSVAAPAGGPDAACRVSLWDGDPLGWIDTRISDPPQEIPGTACTFTDMAIAGSDSDGCIIDSDEDGIPDTCSGGWSDGMPCADDTDCGGCPADPGWDDPWCLGLYRLKCDFDPKVTIPSRNVWMILEWLDGCRMGWRYSLFNPPMIAAVGEENFCAGTCPASPLPCVDLAIELVDGISQWDYMGTGVCCEDHSITCDHSDGVYECGHGSGCADWENPAFAALDFDGWCFGAEIYWAAFVTNIYANTDTIIKIAPRPKGGPMVDVKPSENIVFDVWAMGWETADGDPDNGIPAVKVWQAQIDSSSYGSDMVGTLTNSRPACAVHTDCPNNAEGEQCSGATYCGGAWQNCVGNDTPARPEVYDLCLDLPACDVSSPNPRCGSTVVFNPPVDDEGLQYYMMSFRLDASEDFKGCANVALVPDPATFLKDQNSAGIPLVGYLPGTYCVDTGQCCDMTVPYPFICIGDDFTANECAAIAGTKFDPDKTCDDPCGCVNDGQCDDGDACTDDACIDSVCVRTVNFDSAVECCDAGTGATDPIDDGNQCTEDYCSLPDGYGVAVHDGAAMDGEPCDDGIDCDTVEDTCNGGVCAGTPISEYPCTSDDDCTVLDAASSCNTFLGVCICQLPELTCDIYGSQKPEPMCLDEGEKYLVDVKFQYVPQFIVGGQFVMLYDPTCLEFVEINGVDPFTIVLDLDVDEAAGYIFMAVGAWPPGGATGSAVLATASFIKIGECNSCGIEFADVNPVHTYLTDDTGQPVAVITVPCGPVWDNSDVYLDVPDDSMVNVDCDNVTAIVEWDPPTASSDCDYDAVDLVCSGSHESGYVYPDDVVMNGGEMPIGTSTFCCTATGTFCGHQVTDCWTVEVNDLTTFDVTLQLSPIMLGDVERCINFQMYADCVQAPMEFQMELFFGGLWDHIGHFTELIKIPGSGQWVCVTAMDQQHSLRSSAFLACVDGVYEAVFKGDPFFGGNWLIQGNLDAWKKDNPLASHDVIDILDFGQFVAGYMDQMDPNTDCENKHTPHADINGDGIVDALDFSFITMNFLAHSKNACCPDSAATEAGRTSVTVRELRQAGMGDLAVADLDSNGVVDTADIAAFLGGAVPVHKDPVRGAGSGLRTHR